MQGVQQMTRAELIETMQELISTSIAGFTRTQQIQQNQNPTSAEIIEESLNANSRYKIWCSGGKFKRVPPDYKFPKSNVKSICDCFILGIPSQSIRPFRLVDASDFLRSDQQYFSKANFVFSTICTEIKNLGIGATIDNIISGQLMVSWDALFEAAFTSLLGQYKGLTNKTVDKPGELSYVRFYDLLKTFYE